MSQTNWEADKMLDVYIYDYLVKRNLQASAKAFQSEGKVSSDPVAIDAPGGFLFEWWSVFWDIFIARTNEKHSDVAASYIETQLIKAREQQQHQQQQQQQQQQQPQQQQQQMQMQHLQIIRQAQQQQQQQHRREGAHLLNGTANGLVGNDPLIRQNQGTANALATKMYEERLKLPQRDSLDDASMKQRFGDNVGQLMDPSHAAILKSAGASSQPSGQVLHATAGGMSANLQQVQARNQQLTTSTQDIKPEINTVLNPRAAGPDGSLIGVPGTDHSNTNLLSPGSNHGGGNLTLKGWPLTGLDQLRSGLLQPQKSFIQSSQLHQLQLLTPQQQQQLLMQAQAQQNLTSSSTADIDSKRLRMFMNNRNMVLGKDGQSNSTGDVVQNVGSPMQAASSPVLPRGDADMLLKLKYAQLHQQQQQSSSQQQQLHQHAISSQHSQSSNQLHQQDKTGASGIAVDGSLSNSFRGNDQWDDKDIELKAEMDEYVEDDNVESFLSHDDTDPRDSVGRCMDATKGFTFTEVRSVRASTSKVCCCHFSSDGKLLASAGHEKKAVLWYTDILKPKSSLEEHSLLITDVRFSPSISRLATSSFDKTVRVWDADNPGYSLRTFTGHSTSVMSLDFHPTKEDLICSCDGDGEIRYWSINNGSCSRVFKGGTSQMRFQPRLGRYLAAAAENVISILDVETQACRHSLQGHTKPIYSVCWDPSGEYVASVSEDSVRVWTLGSGSEGECVHELNCSGNKFYSCVFHPNYPSLLVIGCYQSLELWNMAENKSMTLAAHDGLIIALAASSVTGMVASASHDKFVKLWK